MKRETKKQIQKFVDKIVVGFKPEKIILFGSYAWGKPNEDSDVDLFVIKNTDDTRKEAREIDGALWGRTIPLDVLVYTPEGISKRLKIGDFFIQDIMEKGKVLYVKR